LTRDNKKLKIDEGQQKIKIVRTNRIFPLSWHHPSGGGGQNSVPLFEGEHGTRRNIVKLGVQVGLKGKQLVAVDNGHGPPRRHHLVLRCTRGALFFCGVFSSEKTWKKGILNDLDDEIDKKPEEEATAAAANSAGVQHGRKS